MDRKDLILQAMSIFSSLHSIDLGTKKGLVFDDAYIDDVISRINYLFQDNELTSSEIGILKKKIFAEFQVYQEEGAALLDDYEHGEWYKKLEPTLDKFYWHRYKKFLLDTKHMAPAVVQRLEDTTLKDLTSFLGDPNCCSAFLRRGLVIGDVQSGKTSTYIGLICNAVDSGYKTIILLTGTIESLRRQTQIRVEEGLIGFDCEHKQKVGVGLDQIEGKIPLSMTSRENDFVGISDKNTVLASIENGIPLVFVIKKNVTVLSKLYDGLKASSTSVSKPKIKAPLLLIDDEADNASINTNSPDEDPTKINKSIRQLLTLFEKATYVGFTATPFANVFIQPDTVDSMLGSDLFPEHFIYSLKAPSNYVGAKKMFIDSTQFINKITDYDDNIFPFKHVKEWRGNSLFDSFYQSILTFLIGNTIRDLRGDDTEHRSMLINMSRFIKVQYEIEKIVRTYFDECMASLIQNSCKSFNEYIENPLIKDFYQAWLEQFDKKVEFDWDDVFPSILHSIKDVQIVVVNSTKKDKLSYDLHPEGLRVIAIGGLALSRGLTLEGLMVSYFFRNTCTYDVLMQMGRWFGYRPNYEDICRVWIPPKSASWYKEIAEATEILKNDILVMVNEKKTPKDFGIRVRNDSEELGITSRNKMKNTLTRVEKSSFGDWVYEAPYLLNDIGKNNLNLSAVQKLLSHCYKDDIGSIGRHYFRNVPKEHLIDFLSQVCIDSVNTNFDVNQLKKCFLYDNDELAYFDVLFMEGDHDKPFSVFGRFTILPIERLFSVENGFIRINAERARLGGKEDTKYGISLEQLAAIKSKRSTDRPINNRTYLVKGRNPLLIIYFIYLNNEHYKQSTNKKGLEKSFSEEDLAESTFNHIEKDTLLVSFALGIPRLKTDGEEGHMYIVNGKYDYYTRFYKEEVEKIQQNIDEVDLEGEKHE